MKTRKIEDKNGKDYVVEIDENSFKKDIRDSHSNWSVKYSVKNKKNEEIGFGSFSITCLFEYEHLEDEKIFDFLVTLGASRVREDINNGKPIESVGYHISVQ
ncbi:MAG: hypothetical protein PHF45_01680 [Candidatus Pacebacteria bacterium]|nr:hypothetical protein [Candidatus Paceibacterota bacterium]